MDTDAILHHIGLARLSGKLADVAECGPADLWVDGDGRAFWAYYI